MSDIERIARACHETNRGLQWFNSELEISPHWEDAVEWMKESTINGVVAAYRGLTPEELHQNWCEYRQRDGWVYGPMKDSEAKTHPCLVPYSELPFEQRLKDSVFHAIVQAFIEEDEHGN